MEFIAQAQVRHNVPHQQLSSWDGDHQNHRQGREVPARFFLRHHLSSGQAGCLALLGGISVLDFDLCINLHVIQVEASGIDRAVGTRRAFSMPID